MRTLALLAALALPLAPLAAQDAPKSDPDQAVGGGTVAPGWMARTDKNTPLKDVKFVGEGKGFHVTLGPATIFWGRDGLKPFHTLATFTQLKAPTHPEGYGLFVGGTDLLGAGQRYVYFLVRGDGKFLIKQRDGATTTDITKGWTDSPAVHKADANGKATNLLEIDNKRDPAKVVFSVNGTEVHSAPFDSLPVRGIAGLRVNHNLDVQIDGFDLHQ